jgi:hypothetical protein
VGETNVADLISQNNDKTSTESMGHCPESEAKTILLSHAASA